MLNMLVKKNEVLESIGSIGKMYAVQEREYNDIKRLHLL